MLQPVPNVRSHITLFLCTILHAFTHSLATILVPLYLLITRDLKLSGVNKASLLVTIYGITYSILSYPSGILADRLNRKQLLAWGLIGNAFAVGLMGMTRQYEWLVVLALIAGFTGTLFHPAVATLAPAHYPKHPGMAIGIVGMGAGLGFFAGPQIGGWRAQNATWQWHNVADWQRPCIEMAIGGIIVGLLFLFLAQDVSRGESHDHRAPLPTGLRRKLSLVAIFLFCRDFAGVGSLTLASLYLQKALGKSTKETGFIVGAMMLLSIVLNPLSVLLTNGKRRLPSLALILFFGGVFICLVPWFPAKLALTVLTIFQCLQLSSYAVSDAALLERVTPQVRGRVIGFFLTVSGTFAATSPWLIGYWVDLMGPRASQQDSFKPPFATWGALMALSAVSARMIARLGKVESKIDPLTEVGPRTLEPMG